jgi:hypothetical protein
MNLPQILAALKGKGYRIYMRPNELNIVGIRSSSTTANRFDDEINVFYVGDNGRWQHYEFKATTDPGTYYLQHPLTPSGTALLKEGQYVNAYSIGLHRGKYTALRQVKPVTVYRDYNRNTTLDFEGVKVQTGMYYINIHRALQSGTASFVERFSAGCQVFANTDDFHFVMKLAEKHRGLYGNQFSYTLLDYKHIPPPAVNIKPQSSGKGGAAAGTAILITGLGIAAITYFIITN